LGKSQINNSGESFDFSSIEKSESTAVVVENPKVITSSRSHKSKPDIEETRTGSGDLK
jgi:hypothetical protein